MPTANYGSINQLSKLLSNEDASKLCPILATEQYTSDFVNNELSPCAERFKLPVAWHKKEVVPTMDALTSHMMQNKSNRKECDCTCQCKIVTVTDDLCCDGQTGRAQLSTQQNLNYPQYLKPLLMSSNTDDTICTCPKVPLPLIQPDTFKPAYIECQCNELFNQKPSTPYKCLKGKKEMRLKDLLKKQDILPYNINSGTQTVNKQQFSRKMDSRGKGKFTNEQQIINNKVKYRDKKQIINDKESLTSPKNIKMKSKYKDASKIKKQKICPACHQKITEEQDEEKDQNNQKYFSVKPEDKLIAATNEDDSMMKKKKKLDKFNSGLESNKLNVKSKKQEMKTKRKIDKTLQKKIQIQNVDEDSQSKTKFGKQRNMKNKNNPQLVSDLYKQLNLKNDYLKKVEAMMRSKTKDCEKLAKVAHAKGMYPGWHIGHKECCLPDQLVPPSMGWLWCNQKGAGVIRPGKGWRPGSIRSEVARIMRETENARNLLEEAQRNKLLGNTRSKNQTSESSEDDSSSSEFDTSSSSSTVQLSQHEINKQFLRSTDKPTLQVYKSKGIYTIQMNPPSETGDENSKKNILFTYDPKTFHSGSSWYSDSTSTITEDSLEFEFTSPYTMYKQGKYGKYAGIYNDAFPDNPNKTIVANP